MKEKRVFHVSSISLLVLAIIFSIVSYTKEVQAKPIALIFTTHEAPGGYYEKEFFRPWLSELEKRTNGQVKVEAHYGGELVGLMDAYDATTKGSVDMAWFLQMMVTGKFPMDDIIAFTSYDKINNRPSKTLWDLYNKFPEFQAEYKDVKLLYLGSTYFTAFATTKKAGPVTKLEENKGLKMVGIGKWPSARGEALGWTLATLPPQDVFMALKTGVVDGGQLGTLMIIKDFGWEDILTYVTRVRTCGTASALVMNLKIWESLPNDIKKIIDDMREWLVDFHDEWGVKLDKELQASMPKKYGTQLIELTKEEKARWVAVDKPIQGKFVAELEGKGLPGKELMAEWFRLENEYSSEK